MSAQKRNATSAPPTSQPTRSSGWWSCCRRGAANGSISLARRDDRISEPSALRLSTVQVSTRCGSELSPLPILAAEQRLLPLRAAPTDASDVVTAEVALLESAAKRGQPGRRTDGAGSCHVHRRVSAAARSPRGAGDHSTRTLVRAWSKSGGQVIGLAPSAAAAAQLRDAPGAPAETLAKLTWSINLNDAPEWVNASAGRRW